MSAVLITGSVFLICWLLFVYSFNRDRSRYRNCNLLFIALVALIPFLLNLAGPYSKQVAVWIMNLVMIGLLVTPFFLIHNGIVMIRKEGNSLPHLLSLVLGIVILIGEISFVSLIIGISTNFSREATQKFLHSFPFIAGSFLSITIIYGSMTFLIFMIYTLFLQIIPRKKDFDYVIIHGAGLLHGEELTKLLKDRVDKAIEVYRRDPTPPILIPSGGKGEDENCSEAEAMKRYLMEQGIPEKDIIPEDRSSTTLENLQYSKQIIESREGRKYTALVTSNYHVYRALRYAKQVGLKCTGIGSPVAFYYWPSALIREFIAIHAEKKHAFLFLAGWITVLVLFYTVILGN